MNLSLSTKKFTITLLLLIATITLVGCMTTRQSSVPVSQQVSLNVPIFSALNISGAFQVILKGEQSHQSVIVMAPPDIAQSVSANVQNNTLMLSGGPRMRQDTQPLRIQINMTQPLTTLMISGATTVTAQSIGNSHLQINLQENGNFTLQGNETQLHSITNDGRGSAVIKGIHTNMLIVRGNGQGKVDLSGQTEVLNVEMGNTLTLYAQLLLANKVYIATKNNALAFICPVTVLYGFAYANSDIYYYHHNPSSLVRDTYISGNVLKMPI